MAWGRPGNSSDPLEVVLAKGTLCLRKVSPLCAWVLLSCGPAAFPGAVVQAKLRASECVSDFPVAAGCSEFEFSETGCSSPQSVWPGHAGKEKSV